MKHLLHKRIPCAILPILCGCFLVFFALWLLIAPQQSYSVQERRELTTTPTLTAQALLDGSYMQLLGESYADQFPFRASFVRLRALCEQLAGRGENNGVLFGKDGYLIPRGEYTQSELDALERNLGSAAALSALIEQSPSTAHIPMLLCPVPRSIDVNRSQLPPLFDTTRADSVWSKLQQANSLPCIDLLTPLREAADDGMAVWYRTDHHWTSEGAYLAYCALADTLGYEAAARERFTARIVNEHFFGTTYATAGLLTDMSDTITLLRYADDHAYVTRVIQNGQEIRTLQGFYDLEAATGTDPYGVFLGGTNALVIVEPSDGRTLPTLLILKDSYAQSIAPLLARHFRLVLIDPRSYRPNANQPAIADVIQAEQPCAVLLMIGVDTLAGDVDLRSLLLR